MSPPRPDEPLSRITRRGALAAAGALSLAAATTAEASTAAVERHYEGESAAGNLQEALDAALVKLDADLPEGGVSDAMATWRGVEVTGQRGGIAGFHSARIRIAATRSPDWLSAPGKS